MTYERRTRKFLEEEEDGVCRGGGGRNYDSMTRKFEQ